MGLSMVEVRPARLDQPMQVLFFQDAKVVEILWLETAEEPPHTAFALGMRNRVSVHGLHARVVRGPGGGAPMVAPIDGNDIQRRSSADEGILHSQTKKH